MMTPADREHRARLLLACLVGSEWVEPVIRRDVHPEHDAHCVTCRLRRVVIETEASRE
jgi:hypothetical protein